MDLVRDRVFVCAKNFGLSPSCPCFDRTLTVHASVCSLCQPALCIHIVFTLFAYLLSHMMNTGRDGLGISGATS